MTEIEDFLERHTDAIADVLAAAAREALKKDLVEAITRSFNRRASRWEAQNDFERLQQYERRG